MRRMTPDSIREEFNTQHEKHEKQWSDWGLTQALEEISLALRDIRQQGHDVSLDMIGTPSEQVFSMMPQSGMTVPVSGLLRIGGIDYLLGIVTKQNGNPCLKLCVSEFDIRFQGVNGKVKEGDFRQAVRSNIYDLKGDADALVKFQKEIIRHCARNKVIADHDPAGTLGADTQGKKPVAKSALQKPANG